MRDRYVINHTGSSLSAAAAFPTTAHIIPVLRNKNREYEIIRIDRENNKVNIIDCRRNDAVLSFKNRT